MAEYLQIGALIEKDNGLTAYDDISNSNGVIYAILETGRSNDLFSEKQFGEFGEAAILTLVIEAKQKTKSSKISRKTWDLIKRIKGLFLKKLPF